jgi:hypothetical protein
MGRQSKKKTFSFSLTEEEAAEVLALTKRSNFADRNEFLLALIEAAKFLNLAPAIDEHDRLVLRPRAREYRQTEPAELVAAETPASYEKKLRCRSSGRMGPG